MAKEIEEFQRTQLSFITQVAQKVEFSFAKLRDDLYALSQIPDVQFLSKNTCLLNMMRIQKLNSAQIDSIYRTDAEGNIKYSYPKNYCAATGDQLDEVFKYCEQTGKSHFRVIRINKDGSDFLVVALPVYTVQGDVHLNPSNKFAGIIFFTTPLHKLNNFLFTASSFGMRGYPWIITPETLLVSTADTPHLGKQFNEFLPYELSPEQQSGILNILGKMVDGNAGVGQYSYHTHLDIHADFTKLTAYSPLRLPDQMWSIAVSNPLSDVLQPLKKSIGELYFYSITVIFILAFLALLTIQLLRKNHTKQLIEIHKREQEKDRARKEWQLTFDYVDSMVFLLDKNFSIIRANKAASNIEGPQHADMVGKNLATILSENTEPPFQMALHETILSQKIHFIKPGKTFLITLIPIHEEDHEMNLICYLKDISAIEALQDNYHRAQKMESIGLMAGGVAHDLNNILSGIVSYPELILMKMPENSEFRKSIEMIKTSGQRAAAVVNDLLTVARGVASVKSVENLNELIKAFMQSAEFKRLQKDHPEVYFATELNPDLLPIECSPVHIQKCLMNLCTNSAEAISTTGQVVINTNNMFYPDNVRSSKSIKTDDLVILTVTDTGEGISEKDKKHIFEPFYTKKVMGKSGTGLGLSVVWNTMEDHDGEIEIISGKNGSSFILSFPATKEKIKKKKPSGDIKDMMGNGEHVLVVDDEEMQREIARQMLTTLGYHATSVQSGEEAIAFLQKQSVSLVLLDMVMDPGINGCETYEQILRINPQQKAVIVSGYSENVLVKRVLLLGAGALIRKPYTLKQLASTMQSVLHRTNGDDSYLNSDVN